MAWIKDKSLSYKTKPRYAGGGQLSGKAEDWGLFLFQDWKFSCPGNPSRRTQNVSQRQTPPLCTGLSLGRHLQPRRALWQRPLQGERMVPRSRPSSGPDWAPHHQALLQPQHSVKASFLHLELSSLYYPTLLRKGLPAPFTALQSAKLLSARLAQNGKCKPVTPWRCLG